MHNKQNIRVLHIISDLRRGGKERQLSLLANYSNSKIENHILAFHENPNSYINEYNFSRLGYVKKGKVARIFNILKYIKDNNIDLIHTWGNSETVYSFLASLLSGKPLLNGSVRHGIRLNTFNHRLRSVVLKASKYILGNSFAGFYANRIRINKEKHFVIYNGIEDKFFIQFDKEKRGKFNLEHDLSENSVIFISIANFIPFKDYFTIINVLHRFVNKTEFHYLIIGKGSLLTEIRKLISKLNLESKITTYSDNPDIPSLLSISDILIHSSLGEGCSNAILEASAAGNIVVASDAGGTKEIVNQWDFLYQYKNEEELKLKIIEALELLKSDPEIRNKIQNETRKRFSMDSFINNYKNVVHQILNYN